MKICLAGNYSDKGVDELLKLSKDHKIHLLQSFADYENGRDGYDFFEKLYPICDFFILDSGAFSMLYGSKKVKLEDYIEDYIQFVKKHKIKHYVELDLYDIIGVEKTEQIRKRLTKEVGYPPIPVWQKSTGIDYYRGLIKEFDYVAIGGIATKGGAYDGVVFRKLLMMADAENCRIHGLGYTSTINLPKLPFYSVDSTSWLSPMRYGGTIDVFTGSTLKKIKQPKGTRMNQDRVRENQLRAWIKYSNHMNRS